MNASNFKYHPEVGLEKLGDVLLHPAHYCACMKSVYHMLNFSDYCSYQYPKGDRSSKNDEKRY